MRFSLYFSLTTISSIPGDHRHVSMPVSIVLKAFGPALSSASATSTFYNQPAIGLFFCPPRLHHRKDPTIAPPSTSALPVLLSLRPVKTRHARYPDNPFRYRHKIPHAVNTRYYLTWFVPIYTVCLLQRPQRVRLVWSLGGFVFLLPIRQSVAS